MRRMREQYWLWLLVALPVIGIGFFFAPQIKSFFGLSRHQETAALHPSDFRAKIQTRSQDGVKSAQPLKDQATENEGGWMASHNFDANPKAKRKPATDKEGPGDAECVFIEYAGDGPIATKVRASEWSLMMNQFHEAKAELTSWLAQNRSRFKDKTVAWMETAVKELRIQRPPSIEEPELAWRGVGVFSHDTQGVPIVRVSGGLVKLALQHPARSQFELTRLVAQAWAPCEMSRAGHAAQWDGLMSCMGVEDANSCGEHSYSDAGWAVSTTIANAVSSPGCMIPALSDRKVASCLSSKWGLTAAAHALPGTPSWKEARR